MTVLPVLKKAAKYVAIIVSGALILAWAFAFYKKSKTESDTDLADESKTFKKSVDEIKAKFVDAQAQADVEIQVAQNKDAKLQTELKETLADKDKKKRRLRLLALANKTKEDAKT